MYKVFFNDSSLTIGSEINKSLIKHNTIIVNFEDKNTLSEVITAIEYSKIKVDYFIVTEMQEKIWELLKTNFIEINASGGLVKNLNNEYLFINRFGKWDLPKGKIEAGETSENGALREVEEECGLRNLQIIKQLDSSFHFYKSQWHKKPDNLVFKETKWFLMNYLGNETAKPQTEEDIKEIRWFKFNELPIVFNNTYGSIYELLKSSLE